jgi:hypothetical protein
MRAIMYLAKGALVSKKKIDTSKFLVRKFMHVDEFRQIVGGRIFSAKFTKQNGEIREMVARLGVKKHLKGGELKYDPSERNNLIVFDMEKEDYRTIKFDALMEISYDHKTVIVEGE